MAKHFIHCCKYTDRRPSITLFLNNVQTRESIERKISLIQNKVDKHNMKLEPLGNIINIRNNEYARTIYI